MRCSIYFKVWLKLLRTCNRFQSEIIFLIQNTLLCMLNRYFTILNWQCLFNRFCKLYLVILVNRVFIATNLDRLIPTFNLLRHLRTQQIAQGDAIIWMISSFFKFRFSLWIVLLLKLIAFLGGHILAPLPGLIIVVLLTNLTVSVDSITVAFSFGNHLVGSVW